MRNDNRIIKRTICEIKQSTFLLGDSKKFKIIFIYRIWEITSLLFKIIINLNDTSHKDKLQCIKIFCEQLALFILLSKEIL